MVPFPAIVTLALALASMATANQEHEHEIATTMVTDTDWLGNQITTTSTFALEAERKAFQTCIFGCPSVTVPCSKETPGGSTVIVVLPLTIPCSLVKCPPCTTCVSTTVSITVCPVITTITPVPGTATIFTTAASIATARCQQLIDAAVSGAAVGAAGGKMQTSVITVTKTRAPVGCPVGDIATATNVQSVCSTFIVCHASRRFTFPLPQPTLDGDHPIDTMQAVLHGPPSIVQPTTTEPTTTEPTTTQPTTTQPSATGMIAERLFQRNSANTTIATMMPVVLLVVLLCAITLSPL